MKITINQITIKCILFTLIILISSASLHAQKKSKNKKLFVRVYDLKGDKINKGYVFYMLDSILALKSSSEIKQINVKDIGIIKTKRSTGHNVLVGSAIGGASLALIGAATSKEETKTGPGFFGGEYEYTTGMTSGEGAFIGASTGLFGGALVGLGTAIFKKSKTFIIDGKSSNLKLFLESLNK